MFFCYTCVEGKAGYPFGYTAVKNPNTGLRRIDFNADPAFFRLKKDLFSLPELQNSSFDYNKTIMEPAGLPLAQKVINLAIYLVMAVLLYIDIRIYRFLIKHYIHEEAFSETIRILNDVRKGTLDSHPTMGDSQVLFEKIFRSMKNISNAFEKLTLIVSFILVFPITIMDSGFISGGIISFIPVLLIIRIGYLIFLSQSSPYRGRLRSFAENQVLLGTPNQDEDAFGFSPFSSPLELAASKGPGFNSELRATSPSPSANSSPLGSRVSFEDIQQELKGIFELEQKGDWLAIQRLQPRLKEILKLIYEAKFQELLANKPNIRPIFDINDKSRQ